MFDRVNQGMYWDRAWKLVEGCTPVSEGCAHCWSARETRMRANNPNSAISGRNEGLTKTIKDVMDDIDNDGPFFNGQVRMRVDNLTLPEKVKKPTAFAVWNDLFHEDVSEDFITDAIHYMDICRHHIYFILTKRPEVARSYFKRSRNDLSEYPHVWLGVTAENQEQADERIPILLQIPAAKRYVSIEPMLGPVDLEDLTVIKGPGDEHHFSCLKCDVDPADDGDFNGANVDWVICGGESGPGARPMHPVWGRRLRDQCQAAGVPFFFKQWGEWSPDNFEGYDTAVESGIERVDPYVMVRIGKKNAGRILDGKEYLELPDTGTRRQGDAGK